MNKFKTKKVLFGLVFMHIGSHAEAQKSGGYHNRKGSSMLIHVEIC